MYETTRKSLMKFAIGIIAQINAATNPAGTMTYLDFDAHGEVDPLPSNDVAGLHQFSFTDNYQFYDVIWGLTISSYNDPNLLNLIHYVDVFLASMRPLDTIPVFDPITAAQIGELTTFQGTAATPIERANTRPVVSLQATGKLILTPS